MTELQSIRRLLLALVVVIFVAMAVITTNTVLTLRQGNQIEEVGIENNRFLENFSNYMTCLIVNEDEVVIAVGEEAYVEICKQLLFRGIDDVPPTIKAQVPDTIPATTTTTAEIGG